MRPPPPTIMCGPVRGAQAGDERDVGPGGQGPTVGGLRRLAGGRERPFPDGPTQDLQGSRHEELDGTAAGADGEAMGPTGSSPARLRAFVENRAAPAPVP